MASINVINPRADIARTQFAFQINCAAAKGLQDVLSSNLGPRGTMKMLVSGSGETKITKDGSILLAEMQFQHPTASLIARVASAQDDITGDGTTSTVLLAGELLRQAEILISEGMHPRHVKNGFSCAREKCFELLLKWKVPLDASNRELLLCSARSSLNTKVQRELVPSLTQVAVNAVLALHSVNSEIDLHMIEIVQMCHKNDFDTRLVRGLVLDHGARDPKMPQCLENVFILTCNVSLEYEKTEVNSSYFYKTVEERLKMARSERKFTDDRVKQIIELKKQVCQDTSRGFVIVNQKGIDPISLGLLANEGILALRRAKRRNMERIVNACGGVAINSLEDLSPEVLGQAGRVSQFKLGEENFTFIEDVPKSGSVTILINGSSKHSIDQIKNAMRDGLRAVFNSISDGCCLPGAGSIELALHEELLSYSRTLSGKEQLGVEAFAKALLVIPRTLAKNARLDQQEILVKMINEYNKTHTPVGVDLSTGNCIDPTACGILDNFTVKKCMIGGCVSIANNLILVDEIIRAGVSTSKGPEKPSL